jgi:hypothetical protein
LIDVGQNRPCRIAQDRRNRVGATKMIPPKTLESKNSQTLRVRTSSGHHPRSQAPASQTRFPTPPTKKGPAPPR